MSVGDSKEAKTVYDGMKSLYEATNRKFSKQLIKTVNGQQNADGKGLTQFKIFILWFTASLAVSI